MGHFDARENKQSTSIFVSDNTMYTCFSLNLDYLAYECHKTLNNFIGELWLVPQDDTGDQAEGKQAYIHLTGSKG